MQVVVNLFANTSLYDSQNVTLFFGTNFMEADGLKKEVCLLCLLFFTETPLLFFTPKLNIRQQVGVTAWGRINLLRSQQTEIRI